MKKLFPVLVALVLCVPAPAIAQDGSTHLLIVTGLSGEPRFAAQHREWGAALVEAATQRHGVPPANVTWLAERQDLHDAVGGRATLANVEAALGRIAQRTTAADRVLVLLFGHGTWANGETLFNVVGPNLRGTALAGMLDAIPARVAVVNTASSSGGFIQDLAAPDRVVITATRTGLERNETIFGGHFVAALTGATEADMDNDGRVSLLEAFEYARREVAREYDRTNRLQTEHAVIDGLGDGQGVASADASSPHARLAGTFHIGLPGAAAAASASPELRVLYAEKERIEREVADLRARRDSLPVQQYEAALEELLVELSLNAQAIRRLEGGL
ncbi:MAG TPA: hypothetical protein VK929_10740 [Longimicrobiales bacterium]|nr:hypothetical protein [Longimicrobiales bacterium]